MNEFKWTIRVACLAAFMWLCTIFLVIAAIWNASWQMAATGGVLFVFSVMLTVGSAMVYMAEE